MWSVTSGLPPRTEVLVGSQIPGSEEEPPALPKGVGAPGMGPSLGADRGGPGGLPREGHRDREDQPALTP